MNNEGNMADIPVYSRKSMLSGMSSMSRKHYPRTMEDVFAWAEELWLFHGIYSQAVAKAVRYFLTEIEIAAEEEVDYETRKNYLEEIEKKFDIMKELALCGDDYIAFGNSFTSVYIPFRRYLICPKCGQMAPLKYLYPDYVKWDGGRFMGRCPKTGCDYTGEFKVEDQRLSISSCKPRVIHWPPQYIQIRQNPVSRRSEYYLDINRYRNLVAGIRGGDPMFLEDTPWEMITSIMNNQLLKFADDELYHMYFQPPSVFSDTLSGWGLPKFLSEFETVVLILLLDRYNECLLTEYLVPFRILSPPPAGKVDGASGDPMLGIGMSKFKANIEAMLEAHRQNPTGYNFLPTPVQYQVLGGDAKNLTPVELMEHFEVRLLNSMGIPQEIYTPSATNAAAPIIGFRMFERNWKSFAEELDSWLYWFVNKVGSINKWKKVRPYLISPTVYENPEDVQLKLQLAGAKVISETTALRAANINWGYEKRRIMEEEEETNLLRQEQSIEDSDKQSNLQVAKPPSAGEQVMQEEQAAQGGMPPGPGMPQGAPMPMGQPMPGGLPTGQPPGSPSSTIEETEAQAQQIAGQMQTMEMSARHSQLIAMKKDNPMLHARVKTILEEKENQAGQQGKQAVRQGQMPPPGQA
jgi:hypothetical protein